MFRLQQGHPHGGFQERNKIEDDSVKDVDSRIKNQRLQLKLLQLFNMQTNYKHVSCKRFTFRVNI
jgi:hypothetical protein